MAAAIRVKEMSPGECHGMAEREGFKTSRMSDGTAAHFVVGQSGEGENTQNGKKRERWALITCL